MNLKTFCLAFALLLVSQAIDINLNMVDHYPQTAQKQAGNHHKSVQQKIQTSPLPQNEENGLILADRYFTGELSLGGSVQTVVLDTTSGITWVAGKIEETEPQGFPEGEVAYSCTSNCAVLDYDLTQQSYGGRVTEDMTIAQETSSIFNNLTVKNFKFGLTTKISDGSEYLLKNQGTLGLAYGQLHRDYEEIQRQQFNSPPTDTSGEPLLNMIYLLKRDNQNRVSERSFAFKFDKNLSLLTIGEPQHYFASTPYTTYSNSGQQNWALRVSDLQWKTQDIGFKTVLTQKIGDTITQSDPEPKAQLVEAVIDSTTKYVWVPFKIQQELVTKFREDEKTCNDAVQGDIIHCDCENQNDAVNFGDLSLYFNGEANKLTLPAKTFVTFQPKTLKCQIDIRSFRTYDNSHKLGLASDTISLILGQPFLTQYYTVFDQEKNQIRVAESYPVHPGPKHMKSDTPYFIAIAGLLLLFGALAALFSVLKPLGEVKLSEPKQKQVIQPQQIQQATYNLYPQQQTQSVVYQQPAQQTVYQVEQYQKPPSTVSGWTQGQTQTQYIPAPNQSLQQQIQLQQLTGTQSQFPGRGSTQDLQQRQGNLMSGVQSYSPPRAGLQASVQLGANQR